MTPTALLLVLVSAVAHATWNFLLKRAGGSRPFVALSKAAEAAAFAPAFVAFVWWHGPEVLRGIGLLVLVATAFVLASYAALGAAYRLGDLSFVYPMVRGGGLLFLPLVSAATIGERVRPMGWVAVAVITAGILVMQLRTLDARGVRDVARHLHGPVLGVALVAALVFAGGTVWDKHALRQPVSVFAYFYGYTALAGAAYLAFSWRADGGAAVRAEWRAHGRTATAVGVLNMVSYGLALLALRTGVSTYVVGFRQLSIAVGVWLGARLLGETVSAARRVGVAVLVAGCLLMAWAA